MEPQILEANGSLFLMETNAYQSMSAQEVKETFDPYLSGAYISGQPAQGVWPTWRPVMVIVDMETMEVLLMDLNDGLYDPQDYLEMIKDAND